MGMWIVWWLVFLAGGIALLLPLYALMLHDLEKYNNDEFVRIGSPKLLMISPLRGLRLQGFIFKDSRSRKIHRSVRSKCLALAILTPLFVVSVFVWFALGIVYKVL